ncbi:MAG: metallophosphoesterase [Bacilli bacterium]|nr:metallophosphoesterase [Bacilli bacterium]
MIYITGDTHGNIDFKKIKDYFSKKYVTNEDYLIILGDAGIVWSENECFIHNYAYLGLTILFIDGNHENFELLNKFPIVTFNGARCHRLYSNVYHILRGEVIELNGLLLFCMGGATSIDKVYRTNRISWWEEENITIEDIENGLSNLEKYNFRVDYVLTHCAPSKVVKKMFNYDVDLNTKVLEDFRSKIQYKYWFFGHYHKDKTYKNYRCFYNDILEIKAYKQIKKNVKFEILTKEDDETFLRNRKTGRVTKLLERDLPEWYYHNYSYRYWYYNLKGITDIAFYPSPFDNHISKDSRIYLHYHGKLEKDENEKPINENAWDSHTWRCNIVDFILSVDKYSPDINTDKVKAQINLVYDQYNGGNGSFFKTNNRVMVRPFPNLPTPIYVERYSNKKAQYEVLEGNIILSQFIDLERAKEYAKVYVTGNLGVDVLKVCIGGEDTNFIEAYDTSYDMGKWVNLKKVQ